jgi:hypothetical protein
MPFTDNLVTSADGAVFIMYLAAGKRISGHSRLAARLVTAGNAAVRFISHNGETDCANRASSKYEAGLGIRWYLALFELSGHAPRPDLFRMKK